MKKWPSADRAGRALSLAGLTMVIAALAAPPVTAQQQLRKNVFSSGATAASGGGFVMGATVGEAAVGPSSTAALALIEGFWMPNVGIPTDVTPFAFPTQPEPIQYANGLLANSPNPFGEITAIAFTVAETSPVKLTVYDVAGRKLCTLINEERSPGLHEVQWMGRDDAGHPVAPGLYFARLDIGSWTGTQRMLRIR